MAVPETVLKKRKRDEDWAVKKAAEAAEAKKKAKTNRVEAFKRAEQYVQEYRQQVRFGGFKVCGGCEASSVSIL